MSFDRKPWFYAGPYVPAGVLYGEWDWPSFCHWQVPGYDPNPPIHKIDLYGPEVSFDQMCRCGHEYGLHAGAPGTECVVLDCKCGSFKAVTDKNKASKRNE